MNKVLRILAVLAILTAAPAVAVAAAAEVQPAGDAAKPAEARDAATAHQPPAAGAVHDEAAPEDHAEEEHGVLSGLLWPTLNFAVLFGGLWWFLREPFSNYLRDRHSSIRKDLVEAANIKAAAAAQLEEIDQKLRALPGEIEALKTRGGQEIHAEEQRIAAAAAAERERLLEQTRREIEIQLRIAKRELVEHTANLAVQLAGDRLQHQIRPDDQERLVDRYLEQVNRNEG